MREGQTFLCDSIRLKKFFYWETYYRGIQAIHNLKKIIKKARRERELPIVNCQTFPTYNLELKLVIL
jgi:hypothetical protein